LDSPCGRIGGGEAAARQAQLAANAPKREFHATFVGGHMSMLKNLSANPRKVYCSYKSKITL
jgi:hypothetical protein